MPYKDPAKERAYQKEYKRRRKQKDRVKAQERRTRATGNPSTNSLEIIPVPAPVQLFRQEEAPFRIQTAQDILRLLEEVTGRIMTLEAIDNTEAFQQARTIGYLMGVALKAVEVAGLENRIIALEEVMQNRKGAKTA